jgi:hypothetical protein
MRYQNTGVMRMSNRATVFVVVEDDETGNKRWWVVDHAETFEQGVAMAEDLLSNETKRTGVSSEALDE